MIARAEAVREKGFRRAGYDWWSIMGTGGASLAVVLVVLNALRIEAKEDFREGAEYVDVATEGVVAWPWLPSLPDTEVPGLLCPKDEDSDAKESPRA